MTVPDPRTLDNAPPQITRIPGSPNCAMNLYCDPAQYNSGYYLEINPGTGALLCAYATSTNFNNCHNNPATPDTCDPATGYFTDCNGNAGIAVLCANRP